ncbi:MAG: N-acetylmuramoyl-L-alanine amidase [Phycisphaerales bacterium]|nr:N-acetylmuramoyl-L-alanine amidase [Phycisphaerales bacterium]
MRANRYVTPLHRYQPVPVPPPMRPPTAPPSTSDSIGGVNVAAIAPPGGIQRWRWKEIVIHHSATPVASIQSMDNEHRNVRKWKDGLGYHFVIGNGVKTGDGQICAGNRWMRQIQGAHCKSDGNYYNEHGIGICLIGNFEESRPSPAQLASLRGLIRYLCMQTGVSPTHIAGHGAITGKTECPGRFMDVASVRVSVERMLADGSDETTEPVAIRDLDALDRMSDDELWDALSGQL